MANLRNCPLCGGVAEMELLTGYIEANVPDEYFIVCSNCGCGVGGANEQEAIELWNNRSERHGHWREDDEYFYNKCSECGHGEVDKTKYCSSCGARME